MFVAIPIMSFMIFVIVGSIIIIRTIKLVKNGSGFDNSNKKSEILEKRNSECINEDIHTDSYHTYCDYCGATVDSKEKKCPLCGAKILK